MSCSSFPRSATLLALICLSACGGMREAEYTSPRPNAETPQPEPTEVDAGYRWSDAANRCEKSNEPGLNPGFLGECGDLTSRTLVARDLRGISMKGARFFRAKMKSALLDQSDLSHAELGQAELMYTSLVNASLAYAQAATADFTSAALDGADLRFADLSHARLGGASLKGAFFNSSTSLPFSEAEAISRGMLKN